MVTEHMQYVLVIRKVEDYLFRNFSDPSEVITYISNMSKGDDKVHKIICMNCDAGVKEMTIGFSDGKISLVEVTPSFTTSI